MLLKNLKASWAFLREPDENGKYRISFEVTPEIEDILKEEFDRLCEANNQKGTTEFYFGRKELEDGTVTMLAKTNATFINKNGDEVSSQPKVYNNKAIQLNPIPAIRNGATVNLHVKPYFFTYKKKWGVSLGLNAVQLLDYKEYEGGNPFEDESGENPFANDDIF